MPFLSFLILLLLLLGHLAIWCAIFNQVHATSWPRPLRKTSEKIIWAAILVIAIGLVWFWFRPPISSWAAWVLGVYQVACGVCFVFVLVRWLWRRMAPKPRSAGVVQSRSQVLDFSNTIRGQKYFGWQAKLLSRVPGNQMLLLALEHHIFQLPRWPAPLDGLVIAHLSDLHLSGKITRRYFELVAETCNECAPDLVLLTGDIVENSNCLAWLPAVLGRLNARYGKYYVLGNHDMRIKDEAQLRSAVEATGFQRAGGKWLEISIRGTPCFLAGNELPWFTGAERLRPIETGPRIILSHSPDQFEWAKAMQADLVLCGHTHGGQIRFPLIGPIVSPSRHGVKYAAGTFDTAQTIMHVSRGISADDPLRWNCPPELSIIKLNSATS